MNSVKPIKTEQVIRRSNDVWPSSAIHAHRPYNPSNQIWMTLYSSQNTQLRIHFGKYLFKQINQKHLS